MDDVRLPGDVDWDQVFPSGDHHWTMGVRRRGIDDFFAATAEHDAILAERRRWLAEDPQLYAAMLPEAIPAIEETIERFAPEVFPDEPYQRLLELGRRCEPDLIWLLPIGDGRWRVVAGIVCFPSSWALTDKFGLPMPEVHERVPSLNATIGPKVDAFLGGFDAEHGWGRVNWSLTRDAQRNYHPSRNLCRIDETAACDALWVRLEHQLLMRFPQTGAVLFALRIQTLPLAEVRTNHEVAARFARTLETMSPEIASYKNFAAARERLVAYLRG